MSENSQTVARERLIDAMMETFTPDIRRELGKMASELLTSPGRSTCTLHLDFTADRDRIQNISLKPQPEVVIGSATGGAKRRVVALEQGGQADQLGGSAQIHPFDSDADVVSKLQQIFLPQLHAALVEMAEGIARTGTGHGVIQLPYDLRHE